MHHALCNIIQPLFERRFIFDSYANRKGKGTHAALDRAQEFARRYPYVLKCDVEHFFPTIDHALLKAQLARLITDRETLWLAGQILDSGADIHQDIAPHLFPGDDLFAVVRPRGLPIGNLTSQFWANVYLNPLDHFIKRELKCPAYVRYVDDVRRRQAARQSTPQGVNTRRRCCKAPTLPRPGNRLATIAWWERPKFCNPQQTTAGRAKLDMARAELPKGQF